MAVKLYTNIELLATPTDPSHIVNKFYLDAALSGRIKVSVRLVSTENFDSSYDSTALTLTQNTSSDLFIDNIQADIGDRILVAGQDDAKENGIYDVTGLNPAILTRSEDFCDANDIILNVLIPVREGEEYQDTTWTLANNTIPLLDTDDIVFKFAGGAGGAKSYTETFTGDGLSKDFTIVHGLKNMNVSVTTLESDTKEKCTFDIKIVDENTVVIHSDTILTTDDSFDVIIIG